MQNNLWTSRRVAYALLVVMTVAVAVASLVVSAPAWWPGHPRPSTPHAFGEMATLRRVREESQLQRIGGYRWQDRGAGVVAVPIERAMELVVAEGLAPRREVTP